MFTKEIYRQYFLEIHRKQRAMVVLLEDGIEKINDDRLQKAFTWHMKREIRLATMMQKLVRVLSNDFMLEEEQSPEALQMDLDKLMVEELFQRSHGDGK